MNNLVLNSLIYVSPMTDSTAWGGSRKCKTKAIPRRITNKKNVLGPNKPLALHELIVRIHHF